MNVESCFQLGYVTRSHGVVGEVMIFMDTDNPEKYNSMESVFIEVNKKLVPFSIECLSLRGQYAIVKFEGIEDKGSSDDLKGALLFLPVEFLPELEEDQFYYHEVMGFMIIDDKYGDVGMIDNVLEANGNDLFSVRNNGKEILIPIKDDLIDRIDKPERKIFMNLPEGLIDVYLK